MFKVGKNITINADQVLEFRGLNDAGEELKIGQIKGSIKDNKKGKDQSVADLADKRALTSRSLTPGCEKNKSGRSVKT